MRFNIALASLVVLCAAPAHAETLLLNCRTIDNLNADPRTWFASPPETTEAMLRAGFELGVAGFMVEPFTTWAIDMEARQISSPESAGPPYENAEISSSLVSAAMVSPSGSVLTFRFNRINNQVTLRKSLDEEGRTAWKVAHGRDFPVLISFTQTCSVRSVPN
ncbi:hypothetical protein [Brevundimonas sp.]|uniref:hypothetical protein n=1 Tax=Brevundimonas sp. TaxID=1871086 RepID=UPI001DFE58ED|nr:hypothetical protein [Brevundimonas sp.]MBL0947595.1 hypothetical protein [Brevundimonas sp.]